MPLNEISLDAAVKCLTCAASHLRRTAFNALLPLLNLSDDEVDYEFSRIEHIIRFVQERERDRVAIARIHVHAIPCSLQALKQSYRRF